ncbi:hypothetical protein [Halorussus caseinilyticus]|uniref:hypothetical protein n=1 Tax=Halorussus caseinilyticus TaxID=3034025 RepID=UPI0023E81E2A|nr:hypothetical protein [Halorussus sp. DT72]
MGHVLAGGDGDVRRRSEVEYVEGLLGVNPRDSVLADGGMLLAARPEALGAVNRRARSGDILFDGRLVERDVPLTERARDGRRPR